MLNALAAWTPNEKKIRFQIWTPCDLYGEPDSMKIISLTEREIEALAGAIEDYKAQKEFTKAI